MRRTSKVAGRWTYQYRAIDQHGQVIDARLSGRRDLAAARWFFARALRAGTISAEVTTHRAPAYCRACLGFAALAARAGAAADLP
jgi:IS6 family transposase